MSPENTIAAAAGLSNTQSSSVKIPVAEQPMICVQFAVFAAALIADCGLLANSEVKNSKTLLAMRMSAFFIADATACVTNCAARSLFVSGRKSLLKFALLALILLAVAKPVATLDGVNFNGIIFIRLFYNSFAEYSHTCTIAHCPHFGLRATQV